MSREDHGATHPSSAPSRPAPALASTVHRASPTAEHAPALAKVRNYPAEEPWQLTPSPSTSSRYDSYMPVVDKVVEASASRYTQYESHHGAAGIATESIPVHPLAEEVPGEPKIHISHVRVQQEHDSPKRFGLARLKQSDMSSLGGSLSSFGSMASVYSEAGGRGDYDIAGEVLVGVYYDNNELRVHVDQARGLAATSSKGYSNPYVKTYLLPDKAKQTKRKTATKKKTLDPVFNETIIVSLDT